VKATLFVSPNSQSSLPFSCDLAQKKNNKPTKAEHPIFFWLSFDGLLVGWLV